MRKLAIDVDDTLGDFAAAFIEFSRQRYGALRSKEDFINADFRAIWNISKEELILRLLEFDQSEIKRGLQPMPGAKEMVIKLAEHYELHIITARPVEISANTLEWIHRNFPGAFSQVHFCSKDSGLIYNRPKQMICKEYGINLIIDDHPNVVTACAMEGIHAYLPDQPWNRQEFPLMAGAIVRIQDWHDPILETLLR